jgi:hypothetical protein
MLKQLDTLIGFAVIMTVVSLLITILTQMISSLLGLRGKNLADALEVMIHKIDPGLDQKIRQQLIGDVLTRPVISDSVLSMSEKWMDKIPLLSWFRRRWKASSGIRANELLEVLKDIAGSAPDKAGAVLDALKANANGEITKLLQETAGGIKAESNTPEKPKEDNLDDKKQDAAARVLRVAISGAANPKDANSAVPPSDQAKMAALQTAEKIALKKIAALRILAALHLSTASSEANIKALTARLQNLAAADEANATALIAQLNDASNVALGNLETWFEAAQDRAQQWFAMHTRMWTVCFAFIMAFILQLDTFRLVTQLSTDSDLRGKLINFSQTMLQKKADEVFTNALSPAAIYQQAVERLKNSASIPAITNIGKLPSDLVTGVAVEAWLRGQAETNNLNVSNVLKEFRNAGQSVAKEDYNRAGSEFADLTDTFSKTGIQLMPDPYPDVFTEEWKLWSWPWHWHWSGQWSWPEWHLFGIVASAALLSLGAPFWFNLLKSLTNLRPALATEIEKDENAKAKKN